MKCWSNWIDGQADMYSKTCLKQPLKKKTKSWFSRPIIAKCRSKVLQNAVLQNAAREHSAILSTFIKLPFVFKIFVLSMFEWPLKTGFTVYHMCWDHRLFCWFCHDQILLNTLHAG